MVVFHRRCPNLWTATCHHPTLPALPYLPAAFIALPHRSHAPAPCLPPPAFYLIFPNYLGSLFGSIFFWDYLQHILPTDSTYVPITRAPVTLLCVCMPACSFLPDYCSAAILTITFLPCSMPCLTYAFYLVLLLYFSSVYLAILLFLPATTIPPPHSVILHLPAVDIMHCWFA